MRPADLRDRVGAGEDDRMRFEPGLGDLRAVGRTLCAFANGTGGLVILGVDDSRRVVGVAEDAERVQERLTAFLHSGLNKPVTAQCGRLEIDGKPVHWIEVSRHQRGYEPFSYDGRYRVRRGRATVAPSPSEQQELLNAFGFVLTERQIVSSATVEALDFGAIRGFLSEQGLDLETPPQPASDADLRNASIASELDGVLRPTLYGLLLFGRDPQAAPHTTSLFVQCAAYDGVDQAAEVLSAGEGTGRLDDQVNRAAGWFRSLGRREIYGGCTARRSRRCRTKRFGRRW